MTRLDFTEYTINNNEEYYDFGEQEICSQFGCGKKLRPEEKLYGDKCISCNGRNKNTVDRVMESKTPAVNTGANIKLSVFKALSEWD